MKSFIGSQAMRLELLEMMKQEDYQKRQTRQLIADAFDKVGNIGLGDIEISSDGKTIYVVNIYN